MPEVHDRFWSFPGKTIELLRPKAECLVIHYTYLPVPFTIFGLLQCFREEAEMKNCHFLQRLLLAVNSCCPYSVL